MRASGLFQMVAAGSAAMALTAAAQAQEAPKGPCGGSIGYAMEKVDFGEGQGIARFSPMPEFGITCTSPAGLFFQLQLDVKNTEGNGLSDWSDRGVSINELLVGYKSNGVEISAGKFQFLPFGYIPLSIFPNGHPIAGGEETTFGLLTIRDHTGVSAKYTIPMPQGFSLDVTGSLSTLLPELNDLAFQNFEPKKDGLGDGGLTPAVRVALTQKVNEMFSWTVGTEAASIAAGQTNTASQDMVGFFASGNWTFEGDVTAGLTGQWTSIQGLGGVQGNDVDVTSLSSDITFPIASGDFGKLRGHFAATTNWVDGINDSHLEGGLTLDVGNTKLFVGGGPDWYQDGQSKGWSANGGFRVKF